MSGNLVKLRTSWPPESALEVREGEIEVESFSSLPAGSFIPHFCVRLPVAALGRVKWGRQYGMELVGENRNRFS
jgi:hypothetical protein